MKGHKGFTLIELLIVVAIIAILAAIAIPNFLAAQVRSKVSRARAEQASLATALESYYIDNNVYPRADMASQIGNSQTWTGTPGNYVSDGGVLPRALTTPVSFISQLFRDPFKKNGKGFYEYGGGPQTGATPPTAGSTWPSTGWIVTSFGPDNTDGYQGSPLREETSWTDIYNPALPLQQSPWTYDPTNGTTTGGDLWRRGP